MSDKQEKPSSRLAKRASNGVARHCRGNEPPRRIDQPEPGFFRTRLIRKGPWVAARIVYDVPLWRAEIDGKPCGNAHPDPAYADGVYRIWTYGVMIDEAEYRALLGAKQPNEPGKPIDMDRIPPVF